jgi:fructose-bisphosphate aldolase class I
MEKQDFRKELVETANKIARRGFGILAADESTGTIGKRLDAIKVENNEENRRAYRELLFTSEGFENYISGVILFEETVKQSTKDGKPFMELLRSKGVVPGIKLDRGTQVLPGSTTGETATMGLDDLAKRAKEFYDRGCRFTKWRAVIKIGNNLPTQQAIQENAWGLARYAAICQENGLVPIVEPEVLADGDHDIETCMKVTEKAIAATFKALSDNNVFLEGCLLKPNMVTAGTQNPNRSKITPQEVGERTIIVMQRTVPVSVPGIMFLSGGQSEEEATLNLNAMNQSSLKKPWSMSFSYGRALQHSTIRAWNGQAENVKKAQETLITRAKANGEAQLGKYQGGAGGDGASENLFVSNYVY